jgi:uncharacterized integral membrane protein
MRNLIAPGQNSDFEVCLKNLQLFAIIERIYRYYKVLKRITIIIIIIIIIIINSDTIS